MTTRSRIKTEHAGAKNGGGYWGSRADAKRESDKKRRKDDRAEVAARLDGSEGPGADRGARGVVDAERPRHQLAPVGGMESGVTRKDRSTAKGRERPEDEHSEDGRLLKWRVQGTVAEEVASLMESERAERKAREDSDRIAQRAEREANWKLPPASTEPEAFKLLRTLIECRDATSRSIDEWKEFLHRQVEERARKEAVEREDLGDMPPPIVENRKANAAQERTMVVGTLGVLLRRLADIDAEMTRITKSDRWSAIEPSIRKLAETIKVGERDHVAAFLKAYLNAKKKLDPITEMSRETARTLLHDYVLRYFGSDLAIDMQELEEAANELRKYKGASGQQDTKVRYMVELATGEQRPAPRAK